MNHSDLEQMNRAWADWYERRGPRNEEAFYTCFKEAWEACLKNCQSQMAMKIYEIEALEQKLREERAR
jgi:hypothetical protein